MALIERKAVSTSAIELVRGREASGSTVLLKNKGPNPCYLGNDAAVTSSTGAELATTDGYIRIDLDPDEVVYGICAAAESAAVHVVQS